MNTEPERPFYPIDTAPKDGTWIELRARTPLSGGRRIAQWNGETWVCKNGDRYFSHDDCWRPIAPTPAPATSEGQTPRTDDLAAATRRAEEAERERDDYKRFYEQQLKGHHEANAKIYDLNMDLRQVQAERDEALKRCKELDAQATKFLEELKKKS